MEEEQEKKEKPERKFFDFTKLKKENFVVILLIGVLLMVIVWPVSDSEKGKEKTQSEITDMDYATISKTEETLTENTGDLMEVDLDYTRRLETTLEELLSVMEGAGEVKVMITLKDSGQAIVEKDTVTERNGTTEVDAAGGSRNTSEIADAGETVYISEANGGEVPYVSQKIYPQIAGVVVCAQGGGNPTVNKNITEAIQALFGIDAHKIKVIKMSSK